MWPFRRKTEASDPAIMELVDQIRGLNLRIKQLEEDLPALQAAHERLRGRFYATKGPDSPPQGRLTKEQLLANFHAQQKR